MAIERVGIDRLEKRQGAAADQFERTTTMTT
jgi:hypothetical protein